MGYIVAYLLGIITAVHPRQVPPSSIPPEDQTGDRNNCTDNLSSLVLHIPPPKSYTDKSCQCCHHKTPWWKILLDILTFVAAALAAAAAIYYAGVTSNMWIEMKRQTGTAKKQFEAMDRPWVVMDISDISFNGAVVYSNGLNVPLIFSPKNIGRSPAQNIWIEPKIVPGFMDTDVRDAQKKLCETAEKHDELLRSFLVPGGNYRQPIGLSMSASDNDSIMPVRNDRPDPLINAILIGCIDYTYESSDRHHQTGFAYDLVSKEGLIPSKSGSPFKLGTIFLRTHPRGGFSAN